MIGADGLHSNVRGLAFGQESRYVEHIGIFVATLPVSGLDIDPADIVMYNSPGKAVTIHPSRGKALAAFMYRASMPSDFNHRDTAQHKRMLAAAFDGEAWFVPEILSLVPGTADLYFDSVSRVRMPSWSRGRIALLGDAAAGVSLFGDGSSSALVGAFTLASLLGSGPVEPALREYERVHRRVVEPKSRRVGLASHLLVPATRPGIALRNAASRFIRS